MTPHARERRNTSIAIIDRAQKEAGIRKSHSGGKAYAVEGRKAAFIWAEFEPTHGVCVVETLVPFRDHFSAEFVGMVVPDPSQAGVAGGLVVHHANQDSCTHAGRHASLSRA